MARGVNKAIILGHLGGDPELRATPGGISVASFSVATSEQWKDKQSGEAKERTEWHRCEAWGRLGEVCSEYLRKGSKVFIEGSIRTEKWTDKQGIERYTTKIRVNEMQMLDGKGERAPAAAPAAPAAAPSGSQQEFDDDIPF